MMLYSLIILTLGALVVLFSRFFKHNSEIAFSLTITTLLGGLLALYLPAGSSTNSILPMHEHMFQGDTFALAFAKIIMAIALAIILSAGVKYFKTQLPAEHTGEYLALILFSIVGILVMISSTNMIMFFVGLEIMSLSYYALCGILKRNVLSNEAALKYLLMGAFSSAILLMGITLYYGAFQSFDLVELGRMYAAHVMSETQNPVTGCIILKNETLMLLGSVFLLVGFCFKIGAAPFHFWAPDVYQGAPTPISSLMASIVKIASVVVFFRICVNVFTFEFEFWKSVLLAFGVISLIVGNAGALFQSSIKRMLAYSGIADMGFILLTFISGTERSSYIIYFYMLAYSLASVLIFNVLNNLQMAGYEDNIKSFRGLFKKNKSQAVFLTIGLLSMAGIPGTAGFIAKFYVLNILIYQEKYGVAVIAILAALVGMIYYFRLINSSIAKDGEEEKGKIPVNITQQLINFIIAILLIILGFFPQFI